MVDISIITFENIAMPYLLMNASLTPPTPTADGLWDLYSEDTETICVAKPTISSPVSCNWVFEAPQFSNVRTQRAFTQASIRIASRTRPASQSASSQPAGRGFWSFCVTYHIRPGNWIMQEEYSCSQMRLGISILHHHPVRFPYNSIHAFVIERACKTS